MVLALRPAPVAAGDPECLQPLDVVLIIDRSGSMLTDQSGTSRIDWAKQAAIGFVNDLNAPGNGGVGVGGLHRVAVTSYGGTFSTPGAATTELDLNDNANAAGVIAAINAVTAVQGANTPLEDGINEGTAQAPQFRTDVDGVPVHHVFIALSDGKPWPQSTTAQLNATDPRFPNDTPIDNYLGAVDEAFGIAIGAGGEGAFAPDLPLMHALSLSDPENFRHILDAGDLPDLFADLAEELLCGDVGLVKEADPAGPVTPGTEVTYTYTVTNNGETPLINVVLTDDTCPPPDGGVLALGSGDSDMDGQLDPSETWLYSCSMELEETTTNEACVNAQFIGGDQDSDCKEVTVVVEEPPPPDEPGISIVKAHKALPALFAGGPVTYTYDVTNTGDTDLEDVEVEDLLDGTVVEACDVPNSPMSGDDGDGILEAGDPGETWHYECTANVTKVGTTVNDACVSADVVGSKGEESVDDCDKDTVNVPEGGEEGETSIPDTALSIPSTSAPLATLIFGALLVASLGTLAYVNVRTARQRR